MMTDFTLLDLDCIHCDEDIQTREVREGEALDQLRELYRDDPDALPPVIVFLDDWGDYWLADGHYRVRAALEAMCAGAANTIRAEVRQGNKRDAMLCAITANAKHGLPLTAAEKRGVVERLLQDPEWGLWADRVIARHCGVSHEFVRQRRASLSTVDSDHTQTRTYINRWGNQDTMETANIGQAANASTLVDGEWMEAVVTKGLDKLKNAWKAASPPARRSFREWVNAQPDDLYVVSPSEQTMRYNEVIAQACMPVLLATEAAPDGFIYIPDFLSPDEHDDLLLQLRALPYEHDVFHGKPMKRAGAYFGYTYVAEGQRLEPAPPIPPSLQAVIDKATPYYPSGIEFTQCIVQFYCEGSGIGWHSDAKVFGDWVKSNKGTKSAMDNLRNASIVIQS